MTTTIDPLTAAEEETASRAEPRIASAMIGEFAGTFILVFFGVGSVQAAVATGAQMGLWAIGISLAIYATASMSGAHINPAITLAATVFDGFPARRLPLYWVAQLLGAMAAALVLYAMFSEAIIELEARHGLLRGGPSSELSAMVFGEYFPNPAIYGTTENAWRIVSMKGAFIAEMTGTAMLSFVVFSLTSSHNDSRPPDGLVAVMIGLCVAAIISVVAPLTQAGLNPARDFGPRLVSYFLGWDSIAIPGPRGGFFWVYIAAPLIGGVIGAGVQRFIVHAKRFL